MSRHKTIAEQLVNLQQGGGIAGWVKDSDPSNPNRIHWVVTIDRITTHRWTTSEAEAFITGYRRALLHA